jgi:predicted phage gp36 major capsid-like protein
MEDGLMSLESDIQLQQDLERRKREQISFTQQELAKQQSELADLESREADLMRRKAEEDRRAASGGGGFDLF